MDISLRCPCSSRLTLVDAPEAMACHTVSEWMINHAKCVLNAQDMMYLVDEWEDDDDDDVELSDGAGNDDEDLEAD